MKLRLDQVSKRFDGPRVLEAVSLDLEKVHTLVLIGPSGGGKSTLLRTIAGLEYPDSGRVEIDGEPAVFEESSLLRHRRTIGTVFQAFNLWLSRAKSPIRSRSLQRGGLLNRVRWRRSSKTPRRPNAGNSWPRC